MSVDRTRFRGYNKRMLRRSLALVVPVLLAASAFAENKQALRILSFSGQIQIKTPLGVTSVVPGGAIPEIASGSEVIVVSGDAILQSGHAVVRADKGDSFSFHSQEGQALQIRATGTKTSISVRVGKALANLTSGSALAVSETQEGKGEMTVTEGKASVSLAGGPPQTLGPGQTFDSAAAAGAQQRPTPPEDANADKPAQSEPQSPPSYNPLQEIATVSPSAP